MRKAAVECSSIQIFSHLDSNGIYDKVYNYVPAATPFLNHRILVRKAWDYVTGHTPTPATITVLSNRTRDNEALSFMFEEMKKGYSAMTLGTKAG